MSVSSFDVPYDWRDLAERGVEQGRKVFEGVLAAAERTIGDRFEGGANPIAARALGYAESNGHAAFDLASKLVRAKDPQEVFALQRDFLKTQFAALQTQAKELGDALLKGAAPGF